MKICVCVCGGGGGGGGDMTAYLTHKMIKRLQNYYGIAIRSNSNTSVEETRKAVGAVESRHQFCPQTRLSWCQFQVHKAKNTHNCIEKPGLPIPFKKS